MGRRAATVMAVLAVASAAPILSFDPPSLIATDAGVYADGMVLVGPSAGGSPAALVMDASPAYVASSDSGASWRPVSGSACTATGGLNGVPVRLTAGAASVRNFGTVTHVANASASYSSFQSLNATVYGVSGASPGVACTTAVGANITFAGLPHPVTCQHEFGGCPFRLQGGDVVALPAAVGGGWLYSAIVYWGGNGGWSTSVVAFHSLDGAAWAFRSVIANASQYPFSQEGPNENAMAVASDGVTVVAVIRMDAGDGPQTHPYVNYWTTRSSDGGVTWTAAAAIPNAGCARPRMLPLVPGGPLLLSGGRWRNHNTTDILLWWSSDGSGDAGSWADPVSLSYWHNLLAPNATWRFTPHVNSTSEPRETTSYTSLVRIDDGSLAGTARVGVSYNRLAADGSAWFFFMPFTVRWG